MGESWRVPLVTLRLSMAGLARAMIRWSFTYPLRRFRFFCFRFFCFRFFCFRFFCFLTVSHVS
jgi:hypothetical protein